MTVSPEQSTDSQRRRDHPDGAARDKSNGQDQQAWHVLLVWGAIAALMTLAANPFARQWLAHAFATTCILGGILVAPMISVVAWIGLLLPSHMPLHQVAPMLVAGSLIWFVLAIAGAHAFRCDKPGT